MNETLGVWILVIEIGITGWGAGMHRPVEYQSKTDCYEALENIKSNDKQDGGVWLAYCRPKANQNPEIFE